MPSLPVITLTPCWPIQRPSAITAWRSNIWTRSATHPWRQRSLLPCPMHRRCWSGSHSVPHVVPRSSSAPLTRVERTLEGDPVNLGRTYALLGMLDYNVGQLTDSLAHLNIALTLYEQYDRQREIAHVTCNIGHVHLKR